MPGLGSFDGMTQVCHGEPDSWQHHNSGGWKSPLAPAHLVLPGLAFGLRQGTTSRYYFRTAHDILAASTLHSGSSFELGGWGPAPAWPSPEQVGFSRGAGASLQSQGVFSCFQSHTKSPYHPSPKPQQNILPQALAAHYSLPGPVAHVTSHATIAPIPALCFESTAAWRAWCWILPLAP